MLAIDFKVSVTPDEGYRDRVLQILLWALVNLDRLYLSAHPDTPSIYEAGIRYIREPEGQEEWPDIGWLLDHGGGDCEDLACWRVAELREKGINARPAWRHRKVMGEGGKTFTLYHIIVWTPSGFEDPSKVLGMGGPEDQ